MSLKYFSFVFIGIKVRNECGIELYCCVYDGGHQHSHDVCVCLCTLSFLMQIFRILSFFHGQDQQRDNINQISFVCVSHLSMNSLVPIAVFITQILKFIQWMPLVNHTTL